MLHRQLTKKQAQPLKEYFHKKRGTDKLEAKKELSAARYASIVMTALGALSVIPFSQFPTVYEAHGYFHSTLTPPLVVAIFFGVLWKKFSPAALVSSLVAGVTLMVLGVKFPAQLIAPLAHGTPMDAAHPFIYIGALYNTLACTVVAVFITLIHKNLKAYIENLKKSPNVKNIIIAMNVISVILFIVICFAPLHLLLLLVLNFILAVFVALTSTYYVKYDEQKATEGLTVWSIARAKELFKGSKPNETEGATIKVNWELIPEEGNKVYFSESDMKKMAANEGDLVYLSDARRYLGGLKSVHAIYGKPHFEDGKVYITEEHRESAQFVDGKVLVADKEM